MIDSPAPAIETLALGKDFPGGVVAVDRLDLRVPPGCVYGLIGRNGAGKTTAMRALAGIVRADRGSARVLGCDMRAAPRAQRARMAYVSQSQRLHAWMTLADLCRYCSCFYPTWDAGYARELAKRWALPWERAVGELSGGEQRKAAIVLALAARPEALLLDEPAAGLDPVARRELIDELIEALARSGGCTVLLSTHIIADLERIAEEIGIMDRGALVAAGRVDAFQTRTVRVQAIFAGSAPPPGAAIPGAIRSSVDGAVITAVARIDHDAQLDALRAIPGTRVTVLPLGLEDIVIEVLGPTARQELTGAAHA